MDKRIDKKLHELQNEYLSEINVNIWKAEVYNRKALEHESMVTDLKTSKEEVAASDARLLAIQTKIVNYIKSGIQVPLTYAEVPKDKQELSLDRQL